MPVKTLDLRGQSCPVPIVVISKEIRTLKPGEEVSLLADDPAFPADVEAWCNKTKHLLVSLEPAGGAFRATIRRGASL